MRKLSYRRQAERRRIARIALDRLLQQTERFGIRRPMHRGGAKIEVVGRQIGGGALGRTRGFGSLQGGFDDARDARRDPVLQIENIVERTLETIGPQLRAGDGIDQVTADPEPIAAFAHRAFEQISHAELAADLLHIHGLALVGKARIASENDEPADAAEGGDDLLDHAVGEIFLLRVTRQIGERQHRQRRLVGRQPP